MAGLKFYYSYMSSDSKLNYIEIRDRDLDTDDDAIEVTPSVSPFVVEYPEVEMTDVLRGSGATLSFIYKGDNETLREFYTVDSKKYTVYQYIDGVVNWIGYLDSELYEEDFSTDTENVGVELSIGANNGFALLERLPYYETVDDDGIYTFSAGQGTLISLLFDCIDFMGLDYEKMYISSKTTSSNSLIEDILSDVYINYGNFIDEDGEPMYCKDVIVGILAIYGLHFKAIGVNIFIEDGESQLDTLTTYITYDITTRVKGTDVTLGGITYVENLYNVEKGSSLTYDTIVNSQTVTADTYVLDYLVDIDLSEDFEDYVGELVTSDDHKYWYYNIQSATYSYEEALEEKFRWREETYDSFSKIDILDTDIVSIKKVFEGEDSDDDYFISIDPSAVDDSDIHDIINFHTTTPAVYGAKGVRITFDYMLRDTDKYLKEVGDYDENYWQANDSLEGDVDYDGNNDDIFLIYFRFHLKIDVDGSLMIDTDRHNLTEPTSYYWGGTTAINSYYTWLQSCRRGGSIPTNTWNSFQQTTYDTTESEYVNEDFEAEVDLGVEGEATFTLSNDIKVFKTGDNNEDSDNKLSDFLEVRIKNIKIEFYDPDNVDTDNVEYEGDANVLAKDEGSGVTCICNTGYHPEDTYNYRGIPNLAQLLYKDGDLYKGVKYFSRGVNNGDDKLLEELLLAHLLGNTSVKREKLTLTCDYDGFNILSKLTSNYIPGVTMVVRGCTIDYQQNSMELIMCSLLNDSEI